MTTLFVVMPRLINKNTMAKKNSKVVSVFAPDGGFIRSYSEETHGKNFEKLAEEFASKEEGRTVAAGEEE